MAMSAIRQSFLLEGIAEEPVADSWPFVVILGTSSGAKALLSSCFVDNDYTLSLFNSLEVSLKSSRAFVLKLSIVVLPSFALVLGH